MSRLARGVSLVRILKCTQYLRIMKLSISHELANFLDYSSRLMQRLSMEGRELSEMEIRILSAELRKMGSEVKHLHESMQGDRRKDAA